MAHMTLQMLAEAAGGTLRGDARRRIERVAAVEDAGGQDLAFVAARRYLEAARQSEAGAFLVAASLADDLPAERDCILVDDPYDGLRLILDVLHPRSRPSPGIAPTAVVARTADVDATATVGSHAVIEQHASIGERTLVGAHSVVGAGARLGRDCVVHPHVTIYPGVQIGDRCEIHSGTRIGSDGFGYVYVDDAHRKIPQVGGCRLEDDVEVGANVTIDRGSIGDTVVGAGTKIDNLVQIGHNVRIGSRVVIVSQVGISGSTRIGDGAVLGGQAGVSGHLTIGAGARIGAQSGVTADVAPGETVSGYPARPHREALRAQAALFQLPKILRRLRDTADAGDDNSQSRDQR